MQSSHDFEDVRAALSNRTDWSIELFRSCFTIHLSNGNYFFMLCMLSFLVIAENIHIHYGQPSPAKLKERAEHTGYATLIPLFGLLDIGLIIVRITGLVALSGSPAIATTIVFVSMSPSLILSMPTHLANLLVHKKRQLGEAELEAGTVVDGTQD